MRILHISTRLILGGSQENTVLSCEGQVRLGHEVHLAFGPIYGPEGSLLERVQRFAANEGRGIRTHEVPHLVREVRPWSDVRAKAELGSLIAELQPDIVHTHSSKAGILGRIAAWQVSRRPGIVHTIHGPPFMPVEGSPLRAAKVRLNNGVYTAAERFAARRCHRIVSVADAMTQQFLSRGIGRPEQYRTVYSGMEIERYLRPAAGQERSQIRKSIGVDPADVVIGTVARLAQHKGHDDVLDALGESLRADERLKLLWVGDGWWRQRLVQRARSIGLRVEELDQPEAGTRKERAQVILTGMVPPEEVPGYIRAMDVLVHPSYREGLPRTVPQALLCGVVPVAYDVDGTGEICRDGETGRLVAAGDTAKLREAIEELIRDAELRSRMAERGQAACIQRFSAATMVRELERVYEEALAAAGRSGA